MTAAILTRLPLEAGGAVLAATGRAVHSLIGWSFAQYMRAPLASTAVAAMLTLTTVAGSNALYFQEHRHPAPLFGVDASGRPVGAVNPKVAPVVPAPRLTRPAATVVTKPVVPKVEATVPQKAAEPTAPIGNSEVFAIQRKLESLKFFTGTVDGYYGPQTARAIRAFEKAQGLRQLGELNPEIVKAILAAPLVSAEPKPIPAPEPVPQADQLPQVAPAPQATQIVPAPTQLPMPEASAEAEPEIRVTAEIAQPAEQRVLTRQLPETPQEAMNIAADTAGDAIETIINGVQSLAMTTKPEPRQTATVATPAPLVFASAETGAQAPAAPTAAPVTTDPQITASVAPVVAPVAVAAVEVNLPPQPVPVLDTDATMEDLRADDVNDPVFIARVQRGLASLGFLHAPIDGKPGEATARAIRTFETFYNYQRTGRITPELPDLLVKAGATL